MKAALRSAGINADAVQYLNAHGTSTPLGDVNETNAIKLAFGEHAKNLVVNSTKSMTGHLLGGAGGIESVFTALAVHHQVSPPTINILEQDPGAISTTAPTGTADEDRRRGEEQLRLRRHQRHPRLQACLTGRARAKRGEHVQRTADRIHHRETRRLVRGRRRAGRCGWGGAARLVVDDAGSDPHGRPRWRWRAAPGLPCAPPAWCCSRTCGCAGTAGEWSYDTATGQARTGKGRRGCRPGLVAAAALRPELRASPSVAAPRALDRSPARRPRGSLACATLHGVCTPPASLRARLRSRPMPPPGRTRAHESRRRRTARPTRQAGDARLRDAGREVPAPNRAPDRAHGARRRPRARHRPETFIRAYRALPSSGGGAFYTWLYRIAVNTAKKALMELKRDPLVSESALASQGDDDGNFPRRAN